MDLVPKMKLLASFLLPISKILILIDSYDTWLHYRNDNILEPRLMVALN